MISDTFTFSPTVINEFRVGFNRRKTTKSPDASNADRAQKLGIPGVSGTSFHQILPNDQAMVPDWTIGANRLPTSLQNPYLNPAALAYPAPFTPGTLGRDTLTSPGLVWLRPPYLKPGS